MSDPIKPKKPKPIKVSVTFDYPYEFGATATYEDVALYQKKVRKAEMKCEMTRLRFQAKDQGLTNNEWMQVLADLLLDSTKDL